MLNDALKLERERALVNFHDAKHCALQRRAEPDAPRPQDRVPREADRGGGPPSAQGHLHHLHPHRPGLRPCPAVRGRPRGRRVATGLRHASPGRRAGSETPAASPRVNGSGFVCTPSLCPGVVDDPLFTCGRHWARPTLRFPLRSGPPGTPGRCGDFTGRARGPASGAGTRAPCVRRQLLSQPATRRSCLATTAAAAASSAQKAHKKGHSHPVTRWSFLAGRAESRTERGSGGGGGGGVGVGVHNTCSHSTTRRISEQRERERVVGRVEGKRGIPGEQTQLGTGRSRPFPPAGHAAAGRSARQEHSAHPPPPPPPPLRGPQTPRSVASGCGGGGGVGLLV